MSKAIRELQTIILHPDVTVREHEFKEWTGRYVEQLGVAQTVDGTLVRSVENREGLEAAIRAVQASKLAHELLTRDGVTHHHSTVRLMEDAETRIAFLTVLRQTPRGEEPATTEAPDAPAPIVIGA